jgi:thiamine-monophosphate kinase
MTRRSVPHSKAIDERRFHGWLARELPAGRKGLLPLGDDAAAIRLPPGKVAVLSIDSLVEGTHFRSQSPPLRIGAAAAGVSLSDLAAKGAEPVALLLAIVVPPGTPQAWAEAVIRGAQRTAERFGMALVGGDTKPGPVRTVVSSVVGWAREGSLAPRTGARPGDLVATTGSVGRGGVAAARMGRTSRPDRGALSAMLDVRPRVAEGTALVRWAHAMLDTSDGLAEASRLLSEASRVRVVVEEGRLPLTRALRDPSLSPTERRQRAFYGGDYELLLTLPPKALPTAEQAVHRAGGRLTAIGRVARGQGAWLESGGRLRPMPPAGWRPFG